MTGQIICKCGRVAELRRRKNGRKLPFLLCKHCGLQQGKEALREEWLAKEDKSCNLGVFGEFPQNSVATSNQTSGNADSDQVTTSNQHQKEWLPPDELAPEDKQTELATKPSETSTTSKTDSNFGLKVALGLAGLIGLAFGVSRLS